MCEEDLQILENLIRNAIAEMLVDEQTEALSDLVEALKKINEYL